MSIAVNSALEFSRMCRPISFAYLMINPLQTSKRPRSQSIRSSACESPLTGTYRSLWRAPWTRVFILGVNRSPCKTALLVSVLDVQRPLSVASSVSQCEIHVMAKKRKFFCCTGRYKAIRTTRLQRISQLATRSNDGGKFHYSYL